jgi:hypothetical protein
MCQSTYGGNVFCRTISEWDIVGYHQKTPKIDGDEKLRRITIEPKEYVTDKDVWIDPQNKEVILSNRGSDWNDFSKDVLHHIETYTIPQYGDAPDDMLSNESPQYLMKQVQKYLNRFGNNQREGQHLLDLMKMTHCVQIAYSKLK